MNYDMEKMQAFLNWFIDLGGNIQDKKSPEITSKFIKKNKSKSSSLKERPKDIKSKYNYVFTYDKLLKNYPNIYNLKFDKK